MAQSQIRILCIAPYEGMRTAMLKEAEQYPQISLDAYTANLAEGVELVRNLENVYYDVIISRGGTAEMIAAVSHLPVISIRISVYDLLRTVKMVSNYAGHYAIVGFPDITRTAHVLCDLLQIEADIYTVRSESEVAGVLRSISEKGPQKVICDMITHTIARELNIDAFLITSGSESIRDALDQAVSLHQTFGKIRRENLYLQKYVSELGCPLIVLNDNGEVLYTSFSELPPQLLTLLQTHSKSVGTHHPHKFLYERETGLFEVTGQRIRIAGRNDILFHLQPYTISVKEKNIGIRAVTQTECAHLFRNSFFSVSGSMGEMEERLRQMARTRRPVMISGETGSGKEQIARAIYLNSQSVHSPMFTVDCALIPDKSWDYLFSHESSPLNGRDLTVYFQHLETVSGRRLTQFLAALTETNLSSRIRLIFSTDSHENAALPEAPSLILNRVSCLVLSMPPLRSRRDEIPSLASLYLAHLNMNTGKQIIGPDPDSSRLLQSYDWPGNYIQFKHVLTELATITESSYIRSSDTAELLGRERQMHSKTAYTTIFGENCISTTGKTLEEITRDAVLSVLDACGGNQSKAARQLEISRSTLWRYLNRETE
ncbi:MAG: PrpR N-terminal domain-containing protein [Clostridia bacterium]|nr:PrpR N-terminal domain-containing protein [Clostridia bacterium]